MLLGHSKNIFQRAPIILSIKSKFIAMANKAQLIYYSILPQVLPLPLTISLTELPSISFPPTGWSSYFCLECLFPSFSFESHFKYNLLRDTFPGQTSKVLSSVTVYFPSYFLQLHSSQSVHFCLVMLPLCCLLLLVYYQNNVP